MLTRRVTGHRTELSLPRARGSRFAKLLPGAIDLRLQLLLERRHRIRRPEMPYVTDGGNLASKVPHDVRCAQSMATDDFVRRQDRKQAENRIAHLAGAGAMLMTRAPFLRIRHFIFQRIFGIIPTRAAPEICYTRSRSARARRECSPALDAVTL